MRARAALLLVALVLAGCGGDGGSGLPTVDVVLGSGADQLTIKAEVAATADQRARGLMGRASLPENGGMLFHFREPVRVSFYMKNTLIPLDIAFIGRGIVLEIDSMVPCKTDKGCPLTRPNNTYEQALEVAAGTFAKAGIVPGAPVRVVGALPTPE
ncbi:MAG: DUF192 domain-containing protein [Actinomycetota bacterium]